MKIECLFVVRDERGGPELLIAWDEHTVSQNYEGWRAACDTAIKSLDGDYLRQRIVSIDVPDKVLAKALENAEIPGSVEE